MNTFIMVGKYDRRALDHASRSRTKDAEHLIARYQGNVKSMYAALGGEDVFIVIELPSIEDALKVSISLTKMTGIAFRTLPAIPIEDFDAFVQFDE